MAAGHPDDEWTPRFNADPDLHWKALLRHFQPRQPLIAAVEGFAVAGGTEILQAMDLRVAGESAIFGIAEVRRGLFPLGGSTVRLRRQIPYTIAAELLLTGRQVTASEAKEIGLIGHVVDDGQALAKARELADQIAANGPLAVQAVLKSLRDSANVGERRPSPTSSSSAGPSSRRTTPRRARRPSARSASPSSPAPEPDVLAMRRVLGAQPLEGLDSDATSARGSARGPRGRTRGRCRWP